MAELPLMICITLVAINCALGIKETGETYYVMWVIISILALIPLSAKLIRDCFVKEWEWIKTHHILIIVHWVMAIVYFGIIVVYLPLYGAYFVLGKIASTTDYVTPTFAIGFSVIAIALIFYDFRKC